MSTPLRLLALLFLLAGPLADAARAQEPKPGREWYEDEVDMGFKFKSPDGWGFVPPQPGELNMIGEYASPSGQLMVDPKSGRAWSYSMWIVAFDRRPTPEGAEERPRGAESLPEWVDGVMSPFGMRLVDEDKDRHKKLDVVEYTFEGTLGDMEVGLFATLYHLQPDLDVALVFNGPGGRNWKKFERSFKKVCGTLLPLEVEAPVAIASGPMSLRDRKRAELEAEVATQPGWELYVTDNYFVISSNEDREFLEELMDRLEAIREVYEETYPPALALELKRVAAAAKAAAGEQGEDEDAEGEQEDEDRTVAERADPMELSRTSVVRVCKDSAEYHSYGGPGGSAGYWSPGQRELVIYDDKAVGGRGDTWATLNHEAFHQYIFYFFGNLTPHYWYNEGTGDFYSGYEYKNKRFTLKPFDWRERTIQDMIRQETYVPLKDFVRYDRSQYYDPQTVGQNYSQGWGLVYFLRTGKKGARCWNDDWDTILETYLRVLVETDDLDEAVDAAFEGVDWEELEECWKSYIG
jgi:hypothetical protein